VVEANAQVEPELPPLLQPKNSTPFLDFPTIVGGSGRDWVVLSDQSTFPLEVSANRLGWFGLLLVLMP
jgi:hypothetical protein